MRAMWMMPYSRHMPTPSFPTMNRNVTPPAGTVARGAEDQMAGETALAPAAVLVAAAPTTSSNSPMTSHAAAWATPRLWRLGGAHGGRSFYSTD